MIVIIALDRTEVEIGPGDRIQLTYNEKNIRYTTESGKQLTSTEGSQVVLLEEKFLVEQVVNFCCFYRFTAEDGSFEEQHMSAFMGNGLKLPTEISQAKLYSELNVIQRQNFRKSLGVDTYEAV